MARALGKHLENPFALLPGACEADFPGFFEPCHPVQALHPPPGNGLLHEINVKGSRGASFLSVTPL